MLGMKPRNIHLTDQQQAALYYQRKRRRVKARLDPAVRTYLNATMPGNADPDRQAALDTLVKAYRAAGVWDKLDAVYVLANETENEAFTNLVNPDTFKLTKAGTPTFTKNVGVTGNGTDGVLETGINPTSANIDYALDDAHVSVWVSTDIDEDAGVFSTPGGEIQLVPSSAANTYKTQLHEAAITDNGASPGSRGHFTVSRTGSANYAFYVDGALHTTVVQASSALPNSIIKFLTGNSAYSTQTLNFIRIGSGLTATEEAACDEAEMAYLWFYDVHYHHETHDVVDSMTVAPDDARMELIDNLIHGYKAAGVWDKLDALWVMAAHDEQAARLNWKDPGTHDVVTVGTGTGFSLDRGFEGNGSDRYFYTGFVPDTHGVNYTVNDAGFCVWTDTDIAEDTGIMRAEAGTNSGLIRVVPRDASDDVLIASNSAVETLTDTVTSAIGAWSANRFSSAGFTHHRSGADIEDVVEASLDLPQEAQGVRFCQDGFSNRRVNLCRIGAALTHDEEVDAYLAERDYLWALGVVIEAETRAILDEMTTEPTAARARIIDDLVLAYKEAGVWDKLDALWVPAAHADQAARINWKDPGTFALLDRNTVNFTADRGLAGDGVNGYFYTAWVPNSHGVQYTLNAAHMGYWTDTDVKEAAAGAYAFAGANTGRLTVQPGNATGLTSGAVNKSTAIFGPVVTDTRGLISVNRTDADTQQIRIDGVQTTESAAPADDLPADAFGIRSSHAVNATRRMNLLRVGGSLTEAEEAAAHLAEWRYLYALGVEFFDTDTDALLQAMDVKPTFERARLIDDLITAYKSAGVWAKLDFLHVFAAHDDQAASLNWMDPSNFALTHTGTKLFVRDKGYGGDGINSNYYNGWVPSVDAVNYQLDDCHIAVWEDIEPPSLDYSFWISPGTATGRADLKTQHTDNAMYGRLNNATAVKGPTVTTNIGCSSLHRTNSTSIDFRQNGVQLGNYTSSATVDLSDSPYGMWGANVGAQEHRKNLARAGAALTEAEELAAFNAEKAYLRAVGVLIPAYEQETNDILAAMDNEPDITRATAIDDLVRAYKAAGIWSKIDALWVPAAHDAQAASLNWKDPGSSFTITKSGTGDGFTMDKGFAGNMSDVYYYTGWDPSTDGVGFVLDDAAIGVWTDVELETEAGLINCEPGEPGTLHVTPLRHDGNMAVAMNSAEVTFSAPSNPQGCFSMSRLASTGFKVYQDGSEIQDITQVSTTLANGAEGIAFARHDPSTRRVNLCRVGAGLSGAEEALAYAAERDYLVTLGVF